MYKELFETGSHTNPYINIFSPAKQETITRAEALLSCRFPDELKACLLEIDGDGDLYFSAERILTENQFIREALAECYPDLGQYLFIAGNGCGDYYGYRLTDGQVLGGELVLWDHETNTDRVVAQDLASLITLMYIDGVL